ncbi:hypothetical protein G9A89_002371 [Geosiphon pyriformis]|nr:hypothetical protein G9A89_002371 [Geosiphon pyriformis]
MNKFVGIQIFTSGLNSGHMGSGIAIIMNNFLAQHVCKVLDIPGQFLSIKLFFKNKLSVLVLGLYAGSSLAVCFFQADDINSLIAKAVNKSFFVILGGDFNEDGSHKSASFRKYFDLGLVNSLSRSLFGKEAMWANSHRVTKIIDYVFMSSSLVNAILDCDVSGVEEYFDTDHKAVSVSVGLGGLLDVQLNSLYKQANKDCWKYNFIKFKEDMSANAAMFYNEFYAAKMSLDLDTMWGHFHQVVCLSAENVSKKKWFKDFDSVYNKVSSRFHKLKLLVSKIVKASHLVSHEKFVSLLNTWKEINPANAFVVDFLFLSGFYFDTIRSALAKIRKSYYLSKLSKSNHAKESQIKLAIDKRMKSFELNKVVLDHLVVGDKLVLDSAPVKSKVDEIMEGYVFDEAFSGVIDLIDFNKLFGIVSNLPDGKAAGLSAKKSESHRFVPIGICNKWDAMICKGLKLKSGLSLDFPSDSIHHLSFYGLKSFLQIQSEDKVASLINFANSGGIVGRLFSYRSHDLQVLCWHPIYPLSSPVHIHISASNNFLKLDFCGPIPEWFRLSAMFLAGEDSFSVRISVLADMSSLDILGSSGFGSICNRFSRVDARMLSVYTDGLLRNLGTVGCKAGAAAFFENIGMGLGVGVSGLMSSTMAELQAIALALECVSVFSNVHLFLDIQSALDAYKLELGMVLNVAWHKVKGHSGVLGNEYADVIAGANSVSDWFFPPRLDKHFLMADGNIVSGNSRHFVCNTFHVMCYAHWEVGSGSKFLPDNLLYPSVLCLYCGNVKVSDHVFSCEVNDSAWRQLLDSHMNTWKTLSGSSVSSSYSSSPTSVSGLTLHLFAGVIDLLGINEAFGVHFGFHKSCMFFSSIGNSVSVYIAV